MIHIQGTGFILPFSLAVALVCSCCQGSSQTEQLHEAVRRGDIGRVRALLDAGVDVDSAKTEIVGLEVGEPRLQKMTPLLWAAFHSRAEIIDLLVQRGANLEKPDAEGWTPLMMAAVHADPRSIRSLIGAGASVTARSKHGETPLELAADFNGAVPVLLIYDATVRSSMADVILPKALKVAARTLQDRRGSHTAFEVLSVWSQNRARRFGHPVIDAIVARKDVAELREILARVGDVDRKDPQGWTPLMWAAGYYGTLDGMRCVLEAGANVNLASDHGWTPLMAAAEVGDSARVSALLAAGANPNACEDTCLEGPLHVAAYYGDLGMIRMLLEAGADPNARSYGGRVPNELVECREDATQNEAILAVLRAASESHPR